jgi:hypothetical protein
LLLLLYLPQLDPDVYKWPMCAFITALLMNLLTLLFERE